jgi:hypothetical protein
MNSRCVAQTFLSAGLGDFPVAPLKTGLESPVNPQAGKPALRGSRSQLMSSMCVLPNILGRLRLCAAMLVAMVALAASGAPLELLKAGEIVFATDFEGAEGLKGWQGAGRLVPGATGGQALCIENSAGRGTSVSRSLPVERVRGCQILIRSRVRAEKVSAKPNSWNGIKCMLAIEAPAGRQWPQAQIDTGTFDWRDAVFSVRVPPDATGMTLVLGLEEVTGTVWFDDVRISVKREPIVAPPPRPGAMYKGHALPRLRGTMISPDITPESLQVLGKEWNANVLRWQLIRTGNTAKDASPETYDRWLESALKRLDAALPLCERYGLYVVVDLHSPPGGKPTAGGYAGSDSDLFTDKSAQDRFVAVWEQIARRYKGAKAIWGYDLANEPRFGRLIRSARSSSSRRTGDRPAAWNISRPSTCRTWSIASTCTFRTASRTRGCSRRARRCGIRGGWRGATGIGRRSKLR